jgi:hypothetical protein
MRNGVGLSTNVLRRGQSRFEVPPALSNRELSSRVNKIHS